MSGSPGWSKVTPALRFTDFSGRSGCAPHVWASGELTGNVRTSTQVGAPFLNTRLWPVFDKYSCMRGGARNPVLTEPRRARPRDTANRIASFPSDVEPKSV